MHWKIKMILNGCQLPIVKGVGAGVGSGEGKGVGKPVWSTPSFIQLCIELYLGKNSLQFKFLDKPIINYFEIRSTYHIF